MSYKRKSKDFNPFSCGVTHFFNKVGGKWKILIFHGVSTGYNRLSTLQKAIPQVSKQMIINQLRELENDNIIERIAFAEVPPRVEYKITRYGKSLLPVIRTVQQWGLRDMKKR